MKKEFPIRSDLPKDFSLKARLKSFRFAFEGLQEFFKAQHNAIIHLMMTILVFSGAIFFKISKTEFISLSLAVGFVWAAELFNTAIEELADLISKDPHPKVKFLKDVSAAAVLVAAAMAIIIGTIVFAPKIFV